MKIRPLFLTLTAFALLFFQTFAFASQSAQVAGTFYSANPDELEKQIVKFLQSTNVPSLFTPRILIVPHAGYEYSGAVAGQAFSQIRGSDISVVIVLGVAHEYGLEGAAIDPQGTFETPFGKIDIDQPTALRLMGLSKKIKPNSKAFTGEHSVETTLPFLQKSLEKFQLVPMLMHRPDLKEAREIGDAIATAIKENEAAGKKTLLVVSTDFAHYPTRENAEMSDLAMLKWIEKVDPEGLFAESQAMRQKKIPNLSTTMCGEAPLLAGLYAARALGISQAEILQHATSADSVQGNANRVVGYASAALYDKKGGLQKEIAESLRVVLTEAQKKELLTSAREAVRDFVESGQVREKLKMDHEAFSKPQAVFVTLRKDGELRGCLGTTFPKYPLKQAVIYYAVAAATQDPRFPPVTKEELDSLSYEISILSPQKPVSGPDKIEAGKDGVVLIQGKRNGLFLPQVWKETGWTKEEFLSQLASQKAGLAADAWKDPRTRLYTFTAETFSDV